MSVNDFMQGKEEALELIKNALREFSSLEDDTYFFHASIEGENIVAKQSFRDADFTATAPMTAPMTTVMDFFKELAEIKGLDIDFSEFECCNDAFHYELAVELKKKGLPEDIREIIENDADYEEFFADIAWKIWLDAKKEIEEL